MNRSGIRLGVTLVLLVSACGGLGGCIADGGEGSLTTLIDEAMSSEDRATVKTMPSDEAWKFLTPDRNLAERTFGIGKARERLGREIKQDAKEMLYKSEVPSKSLDELVVNASRDLNAALLEFHRQRTAGGDSGPIVVAMGKINYDGDGRRFTQAVNKIYNTLSASPDFDQKVAFVSYSESEADSILRRVAGDDYQRIFGDSQGRITVGPTSYPPSHVYVLTGDAYLESMSPIEQRITLDMALYHPQSRQTIPGTFTKSEEHIYLHPYYETGGYTGPAWITSSTNNSLRSSFAAANPNGQ